MTDYKEREIRMEIKNSINNMMYDMDQQNQFTTDHSPAEFVSTSGFVSPTIANNVGGEVEASHTVDILRYSYQEEQPTEIQSFNKYYADEWDRAQQRYNLAMQSEEAVHSFPSPPIPSSPQVFGINMDLNNGAPFIEEENMYHLVDAFDNIILSQSTANGETRNEVSQNNRQESNNAAISKTQDWIWEAEQMLQDETYSSTETNSAYTP